MSRFIAKKLSKFIAKMILSSSQNKFTFDTTHTYQTKPERQEYPYYQISIQVFLTLSSSNTSILYFHKLWCNDGFKNELILVQMEETKNMGRRKYSFRSNIQVHSFFFFETELVVLNIEKIYLILRKCLSTLNKFEIREHVENPNRH